MYSKLSHHLSSHCSAASRFVECRAKPRCSQLWILSEGHEAGEVVNEGWMTEVRWIGGRHGGLRKVPVGYKRRGVEKTEKKLGELKFWEEGIFEKMFSSRVFASQGAKILNGVLRSQNFEQSFDIKRQFQSVENIMTVLIRRCWTTLTVANHSFWCSLEVFSKMTKSVPEVHTWTCWFLGTDRVYDEPFFKHRWLFHLCICFFCVSCSSSL